jgi:hypothetical protein
VGAQRFTWNRAVGSDTFADFDVARQHLLRHDDALGHPRQLVICNGERVGIRTNVPRSQHECSPFNLDHLLGPRSAPFVLNKLRNVWQDSQAIVDTLINVEIVLCVPVAIDIRTDPENPATSIVAKTKAPACLLKLRVKDDVPLGTAATIVYFYVIARKMLCQQPTIVEVVTEDQVLATIRVTLIFWCAEGTCRGCRAGGRAPYVGT